MRITEQYLKQIIKEELMNEMGMYFDSKEEGKDYIELIRVDKKIRSKWLGPNSMMASDMFDIHDGEEERDVNIRSKLSNKLHSLLARAEKQPSPAKDFDPTEWEPVTWANRKSANKRPKYFAFRNIQDAEEWFGVKQLEHLIKTYGFHIRKVKASKVWISKTNKQLIFLPYTSLEDGTIIK